MRISDWSSDVCSSDLREADVERAEAAHMAEEQRCEVDGGKNADAGDEGEEAAEREVAAFQGAQIDHRVGEGQAAPDKGGAGDDGDPAGGADHIVAEPAPARTFLDPIRRATCRERVGP